MTVDIFDFTRPAFAAAGFSEEEQRAWLSLGLSCAEAETARAQGITPEKFRTLPRTAQAALAWVRQMEAGFCREEPRR